MTIPLHELTDFWGDVATTYDAIKMNVADGGHAAGSQLLDLQVNGVSQFAVTDVGGVLMGGDLFFFRDSQAPAPNGALALRNGTIPQVFRVYNTYTDVNNYERAGFGWTLWPNVLGIGAVAGGSGVVRPVRFVGANFILSGLSTDPGDVGIFRAAPGCLEVNNGSPHGMQGAYLKWGGQARVANDFSITNSTIVDIGGMVVNVNAGRAYAFDVELSYTCAAAGGIQCAIGGSATATSIIYDGFIIDSAANGIKGNAQASAIGGVVASAVTVGTAGHVTIRGTIEVNVAGNLTVRAAQNTTNATATVIKRGSRLLVHDIT